MQKIIFLSFIFLTNFNFAQTDGYWDKERATNKQIVVSARDRIVIKSEDFPIGTTEVIYRITLLGETQELASSLVSLLKAIPDPSGISQGSAGAVFLLSKVSGDDKCKYGIFTSEKFASDYQKTGKVANACLFQNTPVNKEAKLLSVQKMSCIKPNTENIFFAFESKNWIMNQKIVLEIVPWVDAKLSRGWNAENKKAILTQLQNTEAAKKVSNANDFCVSQLEKIQEKYKFQEFQALLPEEKAKTLKDIEAICLASIGNTNIIDDSVRGDISKLMLAGKYDLAISKSLALIASNKATVLDYNQLAEAYILTKQFAKAIKNLKTAESLDNDELVVKLNLAHAYLFNDAIKLAKEIHEQYKSQNVTASQSWISKTKTDFATFEKAGLPNKNFKKILRVLD
jgi:tetratricopeptide (TPR) repeat protein